MQKIRPTKVVLNTALTLLVVKSINNMIFKSARKKNFTGDYYKLDFTYNNTTINYIKKGQGSPILLIHDISAYSSLYEWNKNIDRLSKHHTVYAIDLPGCGYSDKRPITYTMYFYQVFLSKFIKNIIKERVSIVTSGISSAIALQLKTYEPKLVNKLILSAPPKPSDEERFPSKTDEITKDMMNLQIVGTTMYNAYTSKLGAYIVAASKISKDNRKLRRELWRVYYENAHIGSSCNKYLSSSLMNCFLFSMTKPLISMIDDIYVVNGYDIPNRKEISDEYKELNSTTHIITINEAKYLPHLERPGVFSNVVLKALDGKI